MVSARAQAPDFPSNFFHAGTTPPPQRSQRSLAVCRLSVPHLSTSFSLSVESIVLSFSIALAMLTFILNVTVESTEMATQVLSILPADSAGLYSNASPAMVL